ncbi:MAG: hypothetical protein A2219_04395 [Elusimicrobia bacterium RIFOXYA2_FULL_50_26]|nr:MAG: hypothetical protein A2219_04395 [Elusimicrobia bacterium RIFOXYA2_FULL_50_26]OGS24642.1 MAG: hypothetical protein A2314_05830 [Elusimicrobia bacterium RIFOXYB2_FULL_50_12]
MDLSQKLFDNTRRKNIPLLCTFELTQNCNQRCVHCYLCMGQNKRLGELSTRQVKQILAQLARAGTLYLTFTGGEIFLRKDIIELCAAARGLSFDLRLFTNGTLLTETTVRELAALNITALEISVYGKKSTHDSITCLPGSFDKSIAAIRLAREYGIAVSLKTPLMKDNFSDYRYLQKLAVRLGAVMKTDPVIVPANDGGRSVLRHRLPKQKLKTLFSESRRAGEMRHAPETGNSMLCSAGHNLAAIICDGTLYPCLQLPLVFGNLKKNSFAKLWNSDEAKDFRKITDCDLVECSSCKLSSFCQRCPGLALIENGSLLGPSKTSCEIAQLKYY